MPIELDRNKEPVLRGPTHRGSNAVEYPDIRRFDQLQVRNFWNAEEIDLSEDRDSFRRLPVDQQTLVANLLGFFVVGDDIVGEHLDESILPHISRFELVNYTSTQAYIERVHMQIYDRLIENMLASPAEIEAARSAVENMPAVARLAEWASAYGSNTNTSLAERIVAFVCFEGIVFSAAFAIIYWLRSQGKCPGLCKANEWVARDEGIHTQAWSAVFRHLKEKPSIGSVTDIIRSSVSATEQFARDVLPNPVGVLSSESMSDYIRVVANSVYGLLGYDGKLYTDAQNPYQFMVNINLLNNTDLFVSEVTEYAGVGGLPTNATHSDVFNENF